jgi:hypothetical protein
VTAAIPHEALIRRSDSVGSKHHLDAIRAAKAHRTSQMIFGERQYLLRILDSVEGSRMDPGRREQEQGALERLIYARTQELNRMNPGWDQKVAAVLHPDVTPGELDSLAQEAPVEDHFLLRLISEHPRTSTETLARLARHPCDAIRENVARHCNASPKTLGELSRDPSQPLWYLVAFNPAAPAALRDRLMRQVKQMSRRQRSK